MCLRVMCLTDHFHNFQVHKRNVGNHRILKKKRMEGDLYLERALVYVSSVYFATFFLLVLRQTNVP